MSSGDAFHQRGEALENQFFAKVDRELLEKLQQKQDMESLRDQLKIDDSTASALRTAGVTSQSAAALRLVPLIAVAWADGRIEAAERAVVLKAAASQGIHDNQPAGQLLAAWLEQFPGNDLLKSWVGYASHLIASLPADAASSLKGAILTEIKQVAEAAGGVLGWAAVSSNESAVMKTVEEALTRKSS